MSGLRFLVSSLYVDACYSGCQCESARLGSPEGRACAVCEGPPTSAVLQCQVSTKGWISARASLQCARRRRRAGCVVRPRHDRADHRQPLAPVLQGIQPRARDNRVRLRPRVHRRLPGPVGHRRPQAPQGRAVVPDLSLDPHGHHRLTVDPACFQCPQRRASHAASPPPLPHAAGLQAHPLLEEHFRHRRRVREAEGGVARRPLPRYWLHPRQCPRHLQRRAGNFQYLLRRRVLGGRLPDDRRLRRPVPVQ